VERPGRAGLASAGIRCDRAVLDAEDGVTDAATRSRIQKFIEGFTAFADEQRQALQNRVD